MGDLGTHVAVANELTARWCAAAGADNFVLSGGGVWPLLALFAGAANEPARSELAAAVGLPAEEAHTAGLRLLRELDDAETVSAALGMWVREDLPLHRDWSDRLPAGVIERLTGQDALDAWAKQHTAGLIERFPLKVDPRALLVLATALVAKTSWREPFVDVALQANDGPWQGFRGPGLFRQTSDLAAASLLMGSEPVTRVVVAGTADLDVHLLLGTGTPGSVLGAGLAALAGAIPIRAELPPGTDGPGLTVRSKQVTARTDLLVLRLPPFAVRSKHNLLDNPELMGLRSATDCERGHFPAISPMPLCIAQAAQDVLARFTTEGFEAAAVTAFSMRAGSAPPRPRLATVISATFDRPFGFLAIHRPTGLAVVAGWIATPESAAVE